MTPRKLLPILFVSLIGLTACSTLSQQEGPLVIAQPPLAEVKPARPAPFKLYREPWKACGNKLCLAPNEAKQSLQNKAKVGRWMGQANAVMNYYERRDRNSSPEASHRK